MTLSGTLNIPSNRNEKHLAVILVSGYGPQNRDAEWNGHILVNADCLTGLGVAVLRYDGRGYAKSTAFLLWFYSDCLHKFCGGRV